MSRTRRFALLMTAALVVAATAPADPVPLMNAGFEDGPSGWKFADKGMSQVIPEAARTGKAGLRVNDDTPDLGSNVFCARFATEPGRKVTARFWSRLIEGKGLAVYLRFYKGDGSALNKQDLNNEISLQVPEDARDWQQLTLSGTVPEDAIEGEIWIHTFNAAIVRAEIDDVELEQTAP